eukprot:6469728-Amphidinium_carterae.1
MALADTAATRSTGDVGLVTTLTLKNVSGRVWLLLPGLKQSVYRAEFLTVVRALEECQPHEVVSDCEGVVKSVQALQTGCRRPKGCNRDLELRAPSALLPGQRVRWMKAHLKQADVGSSRITADDFQGNQQADVLASMGR